MATRPIFIPRPDEGPLVKEMLVEFHWHPGMAVSQKQKSVRSLHAAARIKGIYPVLEVSTKADSPLGKKLSSFNLIFRSDSWGELTVESAYQGSKVFEHGGPYTDLLSQTGYTIKKDERLITSGKLIAFNFENITWGLEPKTAFYDWLYLNALHMQTELNTDIKTYTGFTDIEFNPQKSINCQARSCALYVALAQRGKIKGLLSNREAFIEVIKTEYLDYMQW